MSVHVKLAAMREERARLVAEMRAIHEKAVGADRDLTAEEDQEFTRMGERADEIRAALDRDEALAGITPAASDAPREARAGGGDDDEERATDVANFYAFDTPEYRDVFKRFQRNGLADLTPGEKRTLNSAADGDGGLWVPEEWNSKFIESLTFYSPILAKAEIIETSSGAKVNIPGVKNDNPNAADGIGQKPALIAQGAAYTESDEDAIEVELDAYKYGHIVKAADELITDSLFDIGAFVRRRAARAVALKTQRDLVLGTGTNQPNGIVTASTVGPTFASATAITSDEVKRVYFALPQPYRVNAEWLLADTTALALSLLKDSTGRYLWEPSVQAGQPDTLLGRIVNSDPFVPAIASNAKSVIFGDLSSYCVRQVGGVSIKVLNERYADTGHVGYRVDVRLDGDLLDGNGVIAGRQAV